jgi:hypothetical protein
MLRAAHGDLHRVSLYYIWPTTFVKSVVPMDLTVLHDPSNRDDTVLVALVDP